MYLSEKMYGWRIILTDYEPLQPPLTAWESYCTYDKR